MPANRKPDHPLTQHERDLTSKITELIKQISALEGEKQKAQRDLQISMFGVAEAYKIQVEEGNARITALAESLGVPAAELTSSDPIDLTTATPEQKAAVTLIGHIESAREQLGRYALTLEHDLRATPGKTKIIGSPEFGQLEQTVRNVGDVFMPRGKHQA